MLPRLVTLIAALTALVAAPTARASDLGEILGGYNAGIDRAIAAIETLRVRQEMIEPTDEGGEKRARAVLIYRRGEGMERDEISSDLGHPVGEYTLESLVGPVIAQSEYVVVLDGLEEMGGSRCYRLSLKAVERDMKHFDGTVWVNEADLGLVRIVGEVADPTFPIRRITFDKQFERLPDGLRLLRRHTGEIDIRLAFVHRQGVMHILYDDYSIELARDSAE
jgi:hypothetical protein